MDNTLKINEQSKKYNDQLSCYASIGCLAGEIYFASNFYMHKISFLWIAVEKSIYCFYIFPLHFEDNLPIIFRSHKLRISDPDGQTKLISHSASYKS
jgi:hypothetical protein